MNLSINPSSCLTKSPNGALRRSRKRNNTSAPFGLAGRQLRYRRSAAAPQQNSKLLLLRQCFLLVNRELRRALFHPFVTLNTERNKLMGLTGSLTEVQSVLLVIVTLAPFWSLTGSYQNTARKPNLLRNLIFHLVNKSINIQTLYLPLQLPDALLD